MDKQSRSEAALEQHNIQDVTLFARGFAKHARCYGGVEADLSASAQDDNSEGGDDDVEVLLRHGF